MSASILVVDDEPRYLRLVEANLLPEGYQVILASDGNQALDLVVKKHPNLILLDVMMPEPNGFEVLFRLREFTNTPVIIVTARGNEIDRVKGLDLGADDYIVKPFSAVELLARVRAVLRRAQNVSFQMESSIFTHGNLQIDFARAEVTRDGKVVFLSATEYRLLLQFAHNVGVVLSMEQLLSEVWGPEYKDDKEILWVSISRLRQKLEQDPRNAVHIVTKSGLGYIMPVL
jgi:DNA-binding response OmpR family regulator